MARVRGHLTKLTALSNALRSNYTVVSSPINTSYVPRCGISIVFNCNLLEAANVRDHKYADTEFTSAAQVVKFARPTACGGRPGYSRLYTGNCLTNNK